jgi:hypothetical protein
MARDDETNPGGLSRRELITRAGVAGTVVWSAPLVTSLTESAAAGSAAPPKFAACSNTNQCNNFCGNPGLPDPACGTSPSGDCHCRLTNDLQHCVCIAFFPTQPGTATPVFCQNDTNCADFTGIPNAVCIDSQPCAVTAETHGVCGVPCP